MDAKLHVRLREVEDRLQKVIDAMGDEARDVQAAGQIVLTDKIREVKELVLEWECHN